MKLYKIFKSFMFQSIHSFGMYTFKDTPIPLTSKRRYSLAQYLNATFANVVHCIHVASTIHLVTIFTLKIRRRKKH